MKKILLLGAGRSANILIDYLLKNCAERDWHLRVCDSDEELASTKTKNNDNASSLKFDVTDEELLNKEIIESDLVISMLPARFHHKVASKCLEHSRNFLNASYMTSEMKELHEEAEKKGLFFLLECGLDPGIDHMSAMKVLDEIRDRGGDITGFESFTGGLLAPESERDNPWKYKFTWNPRNVVLAGQGTVKFIQEGKYKYIPYHRLFRRTEIVHIPGYGHFEGYANRDSLRYREVYKLESAKTMYRGTFRRPGFSRAWNIFIQLGATNDDYELQNVSNMTHREYINSFLSFNPHDSVELKLAHYLKLDMDGEEMHKLKWLGIFDDELIGLDAGTPAQILEHILKKKWTLDADDRDMIIMWHKFNYSLDGRALESQATLVSHGDDDYHTAMAKTVGLPLGIAAKLILTDKIDLKGVHVPIHRQIYEPVLDELVKDFGFEFIEERVN